MEISNTDILARIVDEYRKIKSLPENVQSGIRAELQAAISNVYRFLLYLHKNLPLFEEEGNNLSILERKKICSDMN